MSKRPSPAAGFTIVELLIVIVVIGILAAITIVAYSGIQQRASNASLTSDLDNASKLIKLYQVDNSAYPLTNDCSATPAVNSICLKSSSGTSYTAFQTSNGVNPQTFCLTATNGNNSYNVTESSQPTGGSCAVGLWKLNAIANDSSVNANNGTVTGATFTNGVNGTANGAYSFNGSSYITVANSASLTNFPQGFSFSAWVNTTSTLGIQSVISKNGPGYINLYLMGPQLRWEVGSGMNYDVQTASSPIAINTWYYLVGTCDPTSGTMYAYLNGALVGQKGSVVCNASVTAPVYIGNRDGSFGSDPVRGSIDDVRIYNSVLNAQNIQALYVAGAQ